MRQLREQVDGVSQAAQTSMVDQALLMVRQLESRPLIGACINWGIGAFRGCWPSCRTRICGNVYCSPYKLQKAPSQPKIGGSGVSYPW